MISSGQLEHPPRVVCGAMAVVLWTAVAGIVVLHWLNRDQPVDTWWFGNLTIACGLGALGIVLVRRVPSNPIGWLMMVGGLSQALLSVGREWAVYAEMVRSGSLPGAAWSAWIGTWLYVPAMATLPLILLLFPDGQPPGPRWRTLLWLIGATVAVGCVANALVAGDYTSELPGLANPIGLDHPAVGVAAGSAQGLLMVSVLLAIASLVWRTRGADGILRQQLRWVAFAGALLGLEMVVELTPLDPPRDLLSWTEPLLVVFFLLSITFAVLRYRLWEIDALISYSLVYGLLTVVLSAVFVAVVAATGRTGEHPVAIGSSLVAAAIVAVAFAPLRDRLQRLIDRRIYGDRGDPQRVMRRLGARLEERPTDGSVLDEVTESIATSLRLDSVAICLSDGTTASRFGHPRTTVHDLPLVFRAEEVGTLRVSGRPGASIGGREEAALQSLAPSVSAVVHATAVGEALQRSRHALVTTREEERRRVRRDLHDGLGPALAAMAMKLDGVRLLVARDPEAAQEILEQVGDDIRGTIAGIRHLVYELRPPALDEFGLVAALAEQAASFNGSTASGGFLAVDLVAADDLPDLSAAIEVAIYRIVSEGLSNVARHAGASQCTVRLSADRRTITVVVEDDGRGVAPGARQGVGIGSMTERAEELGGTCRIDASPSGGTRLTACLPLVACGQAEGNPVGAAQEVAT